MSLRPSAPSVIAVELQGARVFRDVTIPRTSIKGRLRLLTRGEMKAVRAESRKATAHLGLQSPALDVTREWNEEMATRTVAVAVRDPADESKPLAPLSDWEECEDEQIGALYQEYEDHANALDPLGSLQLSELELLELRDAAKKKDLALLISYGSPRLAVFAITTAVLPAS